MGRQHRRADRRLEAHPRRRAATRHPAPARNRRLDLHPPAPPTPKRPDHRPGSHQPTADIAVIIDTSASMQSRELQQAVAETEAVLRQTGGQHPITVHSHDTETHTTQRVLNASRIELAGGGGTNMASAIETAAATRPQPAVIIVLTDGYTPWPRTRPPRNHATVIAVLTRPETAKHVPGWITTITTPGA